MQVSVRFKMELRRFRQCLVSPY